MFRKHHYLSGDLNKACKFYTIYWDDILVGMASVLTMPCGTIKHAYRQHRLVILPDFQGLGIGTKVNDFLADLYVKNGYKYFIRTTHVRLKHHLASDKRWKATNGNEKKRSKKDIDRNFSNDETGLIGDTRIASSYEYLGEEYANKPKKIIVVEKVDDMEKFVEYVEKERETNYVVVVTGKPIEHNDIEIKMMELGIRTEMLYFNKGGKLVKNSKYEKIIPYDEKSF